MCAPDLQAIKHDSLLAPICHCTVQRGDVRLHVSIVIPSGHMLKLEQYRED